MKLSNWMAFVAWVPGISRAVRLTCALTLLCALLPGCMSELDEKLGGNETQVDDDGSDVELADGHDSDASLTVDSDETDDVHVAEPDPTPAEVTERDSGAPRDTDETEVSDETESALTDESPAGDAAQAGLDAGLVEAGVPPDLGTRADGGPDAAPDDCPGNPDKTDPGECGCDVADTDSDGDLTPDCIDECDDDPAKTEPGECGCGVTEDAGDPDGDDTITCFDGCPDDPAKTEPGECGCNVQERTGDGDADGIIFCLDACPDDGDKAEPGSCGCGMADTENDDGELLCEVLAGALVHRYSFSGPPTAVATDSVGGAHGNILVAQTSGGSLTLAGGTSEQYVDLPNDVLDGLVDVTVEAWVTWHGGNPWQRVLDFGSSTAGEGAQGESQAHLMLTPSTDIAGAGLRADLFVGDDSVVDVTIGAALATDVVSHVAVVFDDTGDQLALYLNGQHMGNANMTVSLDSWQRLNMWLGRSQYTNDPEFDGTYDEVRIYAAALGRAALEYSFEEGPNAAYP